MTRTLALVSTRGWLFPILVVFLVLGHACELPAYADLVTSSHSASEAHHPPDGHTELASCDAVIGVSSSDCSGARATLDVSAEPPTATLSLVPIGVARSLEVDGGPSTRPPLFLLFASLLI